MANSRNLLQCSVPKISVLCERLGYSDKGDKNAMTGQSELRLRETTQHWRKGYVTPDGKPGTELRDWRIKEGQLRIKLMVAEYLESGDGERFWPSNVPEGSPLLRYSKDKPMQVIDIHGISETIPDNRQYHLPSYAVVLEAELL